MKRAIGRTGINVHPIGYGAWPLSNVNRPPEEQALEVIARAVEAGVDLIDTADAYCLDEHDFGHNEGLIRKALDAIGDTGEVTVATKVGNLRPGGAWTRCGRPEHIKKACEGSLKRLGVETITLYQLHAPDENVPIEDSVGAMRDLQERGRSPTSACRTSTSTSSSGRSARPGSRASRTSATLGRGGMSTAVSSSAAARWT